MLFNSLSGPATVYYSHNIIKEIDKSSFHLPTSAEADLHSMLHEPGVPPHYLSLEISCAASMMHNLSRKGPSQECEGAGGGLTC